MQPLFSLHFITFLFLLYYHFLDIAPTIIQLLFFYFYFNTDFILYFVQYSFFISQAQTLLLCSLNVFIACIQCNSFPYIFFLQLIIFQFPFVIPHLFIYFSFFTYNAIFFFRSLLFYAELYFYLFWYFLFHSIFYNMANSFRHLSLFILLLKY